MNLIFAGFVGQGMISSMYSVFRAKYYAHEITRNHGVECLERLSQLLFDAAVDLIPAAGNPVAIEVVPLSILAINCRNQVQATLAKLLESNQRLSNEERDKLEYWSNNKRDACKTTTLQEQNVILHELSVLERKQQRQRQEIFAVEGKIIENLDTLIESLQLRLQEKNETGTLLTLRWQVA